MHSLRWPDYHAALVSTFRRLREEEDFVDVTLACNGRKNFTAHKVVLSACSPYFKQLLKVRFVSEKTSEIPGRGPNCARCVICHSPNPVPTFMYTALTVIRS